jgi:RNA polymerase sigma-70 factor (ECF subfamily)
MGQMTSDADDRFDLDGIARRHVPWLLSWLERRVPPGLEADDLAQDVLVVAYRKRSRLREADAVRPYLVGIARKLLANAVRKRARRARLLRIAVRARRPDPPAAAPDGLDAALRALPEELAETIDVYYAGDVTYEETAAILGVSRATVQSRLRRALVRLRELLGAEEEER